MDGDSCIPMDITMTTPGIHELLHDLVDTVCSSETTSVTDRSLTCDDDYLKHKCATKSQVVGYVYSCNLIKHTNRLPKVKGRAILVHELIKSYGLLDLVKPIECLPATEQQLLSFHSQDYINHLKRITQELEKDASEEAIADVNCEEIGIAYDCPPVAQLYQLVTHLAGSSLSAANAIINKECDIAINWSGGWHHGYRDEAAGYCYVNDINIAILHLLHHGFTRILYIDLDLHHGDGVENAFAHTDKVLTVSFHKYATGFFPGSGDTKDIGYGNKGKYYSLNVPLKDGIRDENFVSIVKQVLSDLKTRFSPQVIVCQCGADGLNGDPMNGFNLTSKAYSDCVELISSWKIPLILLGGGGYNIHNTARCWTQLTASVLHKELDNDIPDHSCFLSYRPSYELKFQAGSRPDANSTEYVSNMLQKVFENISGIRFNG